MERPTPPRPPDRSNPIETLSDDTVALLRSTLVIPSIPSCVVELVQNALDAQATKIQVHVDLDTWTIRCQDDGTGMHRRTREALASGERYWTTKNLPGLETQETFGFRGEALASMAAVGLLEIVTKTQDESTQSIVLRAGKKLYDGEATIERATGRGTTVWVRDFFYKWPVRRKQYTTTSARTTLLTSIRQNMAVLSLLQPHVSFHLSSDSSQLKLLAVPRSNEGLVGRWRQLWGRAGVEKVWPFSDGESKPPSSSSPLQLEGFFSLSANHSKSAQHIYVNARPLAPNALHKLINARFKASSFARHATSQLSGGLTSPVTSRTRSNKSPSKGKGPAVERYPIFVFNLTGAVFDVTLAPEKRVIAFEDEVRVHAFVLSIVDRFLRDQGYRPRTPKETDEIPGEDGLLRPALNTSHLPTPAASPAPNDEDGLNVTSVASRSLRDHLIRACKRPSDSRIPVSEPIWMKRQRQHHGGAGQALHNVPGSQKSANSGQHRSNASLEETNTPQAPVTEDGTLRWVDPRTKKAFLVDARTGNSIDPRLVERQSADAAERLVRQASRPSFVDRSALRRVHDKVKEAPVWLDRTIQSWNNPVFPSSKPGIKSISTMKPAVLDQGSATRVGLQAPKIPVDAPGNISHSRKTAMQSYFAASAVAADHICHARSVPDVPDQVLSDTQRFSSTSLGSATFIAQLDRKFLLVRIQSQLGNGSAQRGFDQSGETLVVIDQHAASERIRVERYLAQTCGAVAQGETVSTVTFEEPIKVLVSREEARIIGQSLADFALWGIPVRLEKDTDRETSVDGDFVRTEDERSDYVQVELLGAPRLVGDRIRTDSSLQQDLVRTFASHLADHGPRGGRSQADDTLSSWQSQVARAPPVLIDLINSKACRGAIMFNDELTPDQSRRLLSQLAETRFPFQCAHGRPSLYPLVKLPRQVQAPLSDLPARREVDWSNFA